MRKKIINNIISYTLATAMLIALVACGDTGKKDDTSAETTAATEIIMTETDAVAVNDNGEIVDAETGKKLDEKEIKELTDKGVIEKTTDGKVKINEDKNKKQVKVTVESTTGKVVADSTKTDQKAPVTTEEKKTTAKTEAKTEKPTEQKTEAKTEKKTEAPTQAPTEQKTEAPTQQRTEAPTEKKTEAPTQAPTEQKTETPTQQRTEAPTEKKTEAPTQAPTEAPKCNHNWVWKTHTETVHHDAVTHEETYLIGDAWDEPVYVTKVKCFVCGTYYASDADYQANDNCMGSYGHENVVDHFIHHVAEYGTDIVIDQPAYDEYVEVKDYQYCSKCGERK